MTPVDVEHPGERTEAYLLGARRRAHRSPIRIVSSRRNLMNKKKLSERDICTKFITPAITRGGWDVQAQVREQVHLTRGRVIVRGKLWREDGVAVAE